VKTEPAQQSPEPRADATGGPALLNASPADSSPTAMEDLRPKYLPNQQSNFVPQLRTDFIPLHNSPAVGSSAEELRPRNLWNEAYNTLRKKDSELIDAYERDLLASQDLAFDKQTSLSEGQIPSVGDIDRGVQLQKLVDQKLQDIQDSRLKITVSGKEIVVKEQVCKVVHAILSAKDFIGSAVSAEPHAALAWAGVLVVLPVSIYRTAGFPLLGANV